MSSEGDKISELDALTIPKGVDYFPINDFGDLPNSPKKIGLDNLFGGMPKSHTTKVVAASNTPNAKSRSDYQCDGTDDDVEIQAAIDALPALGGKAVLLEGQFNPSATIEIPSYVSVLGVGKAATKVVFDVVQDKGFTNKDVANWYITIADMMIDGKDKTNDPIELVSCNKSVLRNLLIFDGNHDCIELQTCYYCIITECIAYNANTFSGIELDDSYRCVVANNICYGNNHAGIELDSVSYDNVIADNVCHDNDYGVWLGGASSENEVTGNVLRDNTTADIIDNGTDNVVLVGAAGNLGLGTIPDVSGKLHVSYGAVIVNGIANKGIILESDDDGAVNVITPNNKIGYLNFGDPEDSNIGRVFYSHPDNYMRFDVFASEAMRIISNGSVGIGIGAPLAKLHTDQAVNDAAIPVLILDQADISEGFINFIGSDRGVIGEGTNSTVSVRVELGGVVYRLALYADA